MKSIGLEGPAVASGRQPLTRAIPSVEAHGDEAPPFGAVDYCRLAEECFFLAAIARDPEVAAALVKAGDNYLRCAADSAPLVPVA
jgi:hypothetical protein